MKRIELHSHSRYSDGTLAPAEVARLARGRRVEAFVLTDHDTVSGFPEAAAEAAKLGLRAACGIEINTREEDQVHILGYGFDWRSPALAARLSEFRDRRRRRVAMIVERLREAGIDISLADVQGASHETLGRPHVADALRKKRLVGTRKEAFQRWLVRGKPGYVEPMGPTVEEAILAIKEAGGWASLAHPGMLKDDRDIGPWVEMGLSGIEAYYAGHTGPTVARFLETAARYGLLATGGSDYHGPGTGRDQIGMIEVPDELFARLEPRLGLN